MISIELNEEEWCRFAAIERDRLRGLPQLNVYLLFNNSIISLYFVGAKLWQGYSAYKKDTRLVRCLKVTSYESSID